MTEMKQINNNTVQQNLEEPFTSCSLLHNCCVQFEIFRKHRHYFVSLFLENSDYRTSTMPMSAYVPFVKPFSKPIEKGVPFKR